MNHPMTLQVNVFPTEPIAVEMGGTGHDIPIARIADCETAWSAVEIALGNHPAPSAWLRDAATKLLHLADRVDARDADEARAEK